MNDHDKLFKAVFGRAVNAREHFALFLPSAVTQSLDLDAAELVPGTFVDASLREQHTDLLYRVPGARDGPDRLVYLLFEHQSRVDRRMPFRLLRYMVRIWRRWLDDSGRATERLPVIIPMVLFRGRGRWFGAVQFADIVEELPGSEPFVPHFEFVLTDLGELEDEAIGTPTPAGVARVLLKYSRRRGMLEALSRMGPALGAVERQDPSLNLLRQMLHYLYRVQDEIGTAEIVPILQQHVSPHGEVMATSIWERAVEKGRAEGRAEVQAEYVVRLVQLRFGGVDEATARRIQGGTPEELDRWTDLVMTAESLDQVFDDQT